MKPLEREVLGEAAVYPGHAVTLAWLITHAFPNLEAAEAKGRVFPAALASGEIPGAGGNVREALDFLRLLRDGTPWEFALRWANRAWDECDNQALINCVRWGKGQDQADRCKPLLQARAGWWQR